MASCLAARIDTVPDEPRSIFVLRNNDIGDLLVITPLFEALKRRFPRTRITVGIGSWNLDVLKNNPHVDEVLPINAPWHNKHCRRFPHNSILGVIDSLRYILTSREAWALRERPFDIGIDVLGSPEGSLLILRAGIPFRLGVQGYAGGHSAAQRCVQFSPREHVGRSALRFAELLGAAVLPEARPQLFLSAPEMEQAETTWRSIKTALPNPKRIVVGPGGGFPEKCWPVEQYAALTKSLVSLGGVQIAVVGGSQDSALGERLAMIDPVVCNLAGELTLRETFALVSKSDLVACNSSMLMHVAAAFEVPAIVLLGNWFSSASEHAAQWGHGELTLVLGKDAIRNRIVSANEAFEVIRSKNVMPDRRQIP